jgi:hypothetical protein
MHTQGDVFNIESEKKHGLMQKLITVKPFTVNTDVDEFKLKPTEARFLKNRRVLVNAGGGNFGAKTPYPSNSLAVDIPLPEGYNKNLGCYYCDETNEFYYLNFNENLKHGIYVIDGDTGLVETVIVDPRLNFSDDPKYAIPPHKVALRVMYESNDVDVRVIKEKSLMYTDVKNWQRWINVRAAIASKGFNETLYPYWKTFAPHFDRDEYIDLPSRPPACCPSITEIPFSEDQVGRPNLLFNKSIRLAFQYIYTDGRMTTFSDWSLPYEIKQTGCNRAGFGLSRCLNVKMCAGSAMVEKIRIIMKTFNGDWVLYDTINKFSNCGDNDPAVILGEYWMRKDQWADFSYNPQDNTISYKFCGDKECAVFSQEDATMFQTSCPNHSVALCSAGDAILLGDNQYGYPNLSCDLLENFSIDKKIPDVTSTCQQKTVKIKVYSVAVRNGDGLGVAYYNGDPKIIKWGTVTWAKFAGIQAFAINEDDANLFELNFKDRKGFVCVLAGTQYIAEGKQYVVKKDGTREIFDPIDVNSEDQKNLVKEIFDAGGYFIWQHEFTVPAAKYIARLVRHNADLDGDFRKTSTYVMGISNSQRKDPVQALLGTGALVTSAKEMEIDATAGDVDVWGNGRDLFHVFAPYDYHEGTNHRWRFMEGYVYEDHDSGRGVELFKYNATEGFPELVRRGDYTDHNGFYFTYTARGGAKTSKVYFWGKLNCIVKPFTGEWFKSNDLPPKDRGWYKDNIYVSDNNVGKFGLCNRILVRGTVKDCDGAGIAGVGVTITRGTSTTTDSSGAYELVVHNDFNQVRGDKIYFNSGGECAFVDCNCQPLVVEEYTDTAVNCIQCTQRVFPRQIDRVVKSAVTVQRGLKGGGRYGIGIAGKDLAGRATWIGLIDYLDIPTFLETKTFAPVQLNWFIKDLTKKFPDFIKYISFFRTSNLAYTSFLQWVGDKIEYLDAHGNVTDPEGATNVRITIQSLNEFNLQNNFATTTNYQFVQGDFVRFYDDGDGNLFDITGGYMDYLIQGTNWGAVTTETNPDAPVEDGKSFIIPYDKRLSVLKKKNGFWIEIIRPKECVNKEIYYTICGNIPVVDGTPQVSAGTLSTWDTYYQSRLINIEDALGKTFNHPFESSSITDFWGADVQSGGRPHFRDELAEAKWYPDDVIKSDEFVNEGRVNGLGTYRGKNRKQFKGQDWGGIVAMHAERNIIAFVCENDWFTTDYNMNYARVTPEGLIIANLDKNLGEPYQKIGNKHGCGFENTSTIGFFDSYAWWADTKDGAAILFSYRDSEDISAIDNKQYFLEKFKYVHQWNQGLPADDFKDYIDLVTGVDPQRGDIYFTFRPRRGRTNNPLSFINQERETFNDVQETFVFNAQMKKWTGWVGFCPEGYGMLPKSRTGSEFITFAAGKPYYHNSVNVADYCTFYGVQTERVEEFIINDSEDIVKIFQAIIINDSRLSWFVDRFVTSQENSFSYVPILYMNKAEGVHYSRLLMDMNCYPSMNPEESYRCMIFDGKRMFGNWGKFRIVGDPNQMNAYDEMNDIIVRVASAALTGK